MSNDIIKMTGVGYLEIFIGPMYAGKTSKLQELYHLYSHYNIPVKVINYIDDNRYNNDNNLYSHDSVTIPCIKCKHINDIYPINKSTITTSTLEEFTSIDVYLINEGQFFGDIVEWVTTAVNPPYNKTIYICGLDGDFKRKPFGNWLDIIPLCDKITKLTSRCGICKINSALFSHRLSDEKEQIVIGSENYLPVCRKCYNQHF